MKRVVIWASLAIFFSAAGICGLPSVYADNVEQADVSPAVEPFQEALAVDSEGDGRSYWRLLTDALRRDPNFQLARWYSGQVMFQGQWRPVEAVGRRVAGDPLWREYHYRRQEAENSVADHTELAQWCRREQLENEERWHWQQVLQLDPDNRDARSGLGLCKYRGGWYTRDQIEQYEEQAVIQQRQTEHYVRELRNWINQGRRGSPTLRNKMLSRIEAVDDPLAVEALGIVMNEVLDNHSSRHREYHQEVCLAIVRAFSNIPEHPATLSLLNIAVYANEAELREEAAIKLRGRDETSYMPLLMAGLAAPLETSFQINVTPAGHVSVVQDIEEEHPRKVTRNTVAQDLSSFKVIDRERPLRERQRGALPTRTVYMDPAGDYRRAQTVVQNRLMQVNRTNEQRTEQNARIVEVLKVVTGKQLGDQPATWWDSWQDHNELEYYDEKPIYDDYHVGQYNTFQYHFLRASSCFVAGTLVWTQSGPVPIESIRVGDFVLSQDPDTGRLAYQPVIDTTVRPPSELRRLTINGETITTTLGHRFWVAGQGWRMAKFLDTGDPLFSARGSLDVQSITGEEKAEAYNLVVDAFHTYFVGRNRLLVHDNNCPLPVANALPGVKTKTWELATRLQPAN